MPRYLAGEARYCCTTVMQPGSQLWQSTQSCTALHSHQACIFRLPCMVLGSTDTDVVFFQELGECGALCSGMF